MDLIQTVTDFLSTQGGWGVAVIIGWAYWKKDREQVIMQKEWLSYLRESTEVLASLREVIRNCHKRVGDDDD